MKITKLTPAQEARFGEWTQKWIDIGLSTEPADFDAATDAALRAYKLCNLVRPMIVLRMGSPYAATVGGALAWMYLREFAKYGGEQVESQVRSQVGSQVRSQVGSQVRSQVESQVESQVGSQVRSQVESQVWSQVWSQVESQVGSQVLDGRWNDRGGAFWAAWCAYISFLRDACGWADPVLDRFEIDETLTKSCGWVWWHENVLAISDRPCALNRDGQGRLHNPAGPSIAYRDGWSLHHYHGVAVPADIIEDRASITVKRIRSEKNAEVRRVMIELYGYERYVRDAQLKVVHELPADHEITGLRTARLLRDGDIVLVDVLNSTPEPDGTVKRYVLRVDPDAYDGEASKNVHAAVASTWRVGEKLAIQNWREYRPSFES